MRARGFMRLLKFVTAVLTTAQLCISLAPSITHHAHHPKKLLPLNSAATDEVTNNVAVDQIPGSRGDGYMVTKTYVIPSEGFPSLSSVFESSDQERLQLDQMNVTLSAALMMLDPELSLIHI